MKSAIFVFSASALTLLALACGTSPVAPVATPAAAPAPAPTPTPTPLVSLSGTWTGSGTDSQGATTVTWSVTQTGTNVSGTVATQAVNPNDGSCNSCHRNKTGTFTGTIDGSTLAITMFFAAGAAGDPTPACQATLTGSATRAADDTLNGIYTGADTCEGAFTNGTLLMARRP